MIGTPLKRSQTLLAAIIIPLMAAGLQWLLWPNIQPFIWFLFYPAVFLAAWLGGRPGGLIAAVWSAGLAVFIFAPPMFTFAVENIGVLFSALIFIGMGALFGYVFEALQRATRQVDLLSQLQASETRYGELVQHVHSAILRWQVDGTIVFCNPYAQTLFGYREAELIGQPVGILVPQRESTGGDLSSLVSDIAAHPERFENIVNENVCRDGRRLWLAWTNSAVRDAAGQVVEILAVGMDITERKQAEEALQASETRLKRSQAAAQVGHWTWDVRSNRVAWSDEMYRIFGLNPIGFSGDLDEVVRTAIHPDDREKIERANSAVSDAGQPAPLEYRVVWPDQSVHTVYAEPAEQTRDEQGRIVRLFGVVQDITARKQAEEALRESQARLNFALDNSHTGGWDLDLVDHTAFRTLEHDRIFGYTTLLPKWTYEMFLDHVVPDDRAEVDRLFQHAIATQADWSFECRIRRIDGEVRWISAAGGHQYGATGQAYRMAGIVQDITVRKRAEEALRESEALFSVAFNISPVAQSIIAQGSNEILAVNDTACRLFGYARQELIGASTAKLSLWQDPAERQTAVAELQATGHLTSREAVIRTQSDEARTVLVAIEPITWQGRPSLISSLIDITARKQAEQRIRYFARLYATLSQVNQTIVRTTERQQLFESICQVAVNYGEFKLAWIGLYDADAGLLQPAAWHGVPGLVLKTTAVNVHEEPFCSGAIGDALSGGQVEIRQRPQLDAEQDQWHEVARLNNFQSLAAIPIRQQGQVIGLLNLYAADVNFFSAVEDQSLLTEMGLDISFALDTMQLEAERQQAAAALRESEEKLRVAVKNAYFVPAQFDQDMRYRWIYNPHPDFDQSQVIGKRDDELDNSDAARQLVELKRQVLQTGQEVRQEISFQRSDGLHTYDFAIAPLRDADSLIIGGTSAAFDITERKQAEAALRASEERSGALIEHAPDGIVLVTPTEFKYASPSALNLFGYSQTDLFQYTPADLTHPDDLPRVFAALGDLVQNPAQVPTLQYRFRHHDGGWRWIESTFSNLLSEPSVQAIVINFRDITDRRQADDVLRANLARLSLASDAAQAGFWEWDLRTNENIWSDELWKVYGLEPHTCAPSYEAWQQTIHPADRAAAEQAVSEAARNGTELNAEYRLNTAPGLAERWLMSRGRPVFDAAGNVVQFMGIVIDITARKQAEEALSASEELFRASIEFLPMPIAVANTDGAMLHLNRRFTECYGYTLEDLPTIDDWMRRAYPDPAYREDVIVGWGQRIAGSLSRNLPTPVREVMVTGQDGQQHVVEIVARGINGLILTSLNDVTERKWMESQREAALEALRHSEERFRSALDGMLEGCQIIGFDWRYIYLNAAAERHNRRPNRELLGNVYKDMWPGIEATPVFAEIKRCLEDRLDCHMENEFTYPNELVRWFELSIQPVPEGVFILSVDITDRKQAEAEILQLNTELEQRVVQRTAQLAAVNERLTELDRLKSKFVSDVSHELRTPVTSLSLYIDLLEHGKPEKRERYVTGLKAQMARLHTLINDILDLSRLERDRDEGGRSPVDINSIVEHVTVAQLMAAEAAGLQLTCEVGDNLPAVVARPDQLTRAITNLVSNAIKYTPTGSVRVQTAERHNRVCIEVTDTGRGIPADEMSHLFERFYRGRDVAQSTIPGTGLGLSIVKEIIESHGGTVEVQSELGQGSVFRIWLPTAG